MTDDDLVVFIIVVLTITVVITIIKFQSMTAGQRKAFLKEIEHGKVNKAMLCPHCQTTGHIKTKGIEQKKGVSGGKATAAVLTGGLSLLAVGLSRKEVTTQAYCDNCKNTWFF